MWPSMRPWPRRCLPIPPRTVASDRLVKPNTRSLDRGSAHDYSRRPHPGLRPWRTTDWRSQGQEAVRRTKVGSAPTTPRAEQGWKPGPTHASSMLLSGNDRKSLITSGASGATRYSLREPGRRLLGSPRVRSQQCLPVRHLHACSRSNGPWSRPCGVGLWRQSWARKALSDSTAWSMVNDAAFWRGGNSRNVSRNRVATAWP
jgi:hypothetical protein